MNNFSHSWLPELKKRMLESNAPIQVVVGPRQVGKTTSLEMLLEQLPQIPHIYSSADQKQVLGTLWIEQEWHKARTLRAQQGETLLVLDEVQKIEGWSETIKALWDEDVRLKKKLKVILSGSSALSLQSQLTESMTGRFEIVPAHHARWADFQAQAHRSFEEYIFFGGYPGSLQFIDEEERWRKYLVDSIVETVLSRDILLLTRVERPALLRRAFQLGCELSSRIISYQKMLGTLHDKGNTTTLAHYLRLLHQAFLLSGLEKFENKRFRTRASSPKLNVHAPALMGALSGYSFSEAKNDPKVWGRFIESAVGSYLLTQARLEHFEVYYWNDGGHEVDFVLRRGPKVLGIEVKSGRIDKISGLKAFSEQMRGAKTLVVTSAELPGFLSSPVASLF